MFAEWVARIAQQAALLDYNQRAALWASAAEAAPLEYRAFAYWRAAELALCMRDKAMMTHYAAQGVEVGGGSQIWHIRLRELRGLPEWVEGG